MGLGSANGNGGLTPLVNYESKTGLSWSPWHSASPPQPGPKRLYLEGQTPSFLTFFGW